MSIAKVSTRVLRFSHGALVLMAPWSSFHAHRPKDDAPRRVRVSRTSRLKIVGVDACAQFVDFGVMTTILKDYATNEEEQENVAYAPDHPWRGSESQPWSSDVGYAYAERDQHNSGHPHQSAPVYRPLRPPRVIIIGSLSLFLPHCLPYSQ